ncbi:MAG: queuosine salvage family protein [Chloroflexota bacterium]|nr:queuosine salvage family protein [Chloroflexota bacterium]
MDVKQLQPQYNDPLGVLASTAAVVRRSRHVRIDIGQLAVVAAKMARETVSPPGWDATLHFRDGTWRTAGWVLVLDALNFCFWNPGSAGSDPSDRWRVEYDGVAYNGYAALAAALSRAVAEGRPLWDAAYLAGLDAAALRDILRPVPGAPEIPLLAERLANLREVGCGLRDGIGGPRPVETLIAAADGSAVRLIGDVVRRFPSFDDTACYGSEVVRFYKRAQILVADLAGAFDNDGLGAFADLEHLTAFADYKVPQVLRELGILVYDDHLAGLVDAHQLLPAGSPEEIEIRAGTVWAVELLRRALNDAGRRLRAFEIDGLLWTAGQTLALTARPYHRTVTGYY